MADLEVRTYPYRWVVLIAFMLINVMVQVLWICYAPIASIAASAYGVKRDDIDLLANLFMLIYIPVPFPLPGPSTRSASRRRSVSGPSSWVRSRSCAPSSPSATRRPSSAQSGSPSASPSFLTRSRSLPLSGSRRSNAPRSRGSSFSPCSPAIGLGEILGPSLVASSGFAGMQLIYGIVTAATVVLFLVFAWEKPPTASPPSEQSRALVLDGLRQILKKRDVYLLSLPCSSGAGS